MDEETETDIQMGMVARTETNGWPGTDGWIEIDSWSEKDG